MSDRLGQVASPNLPLATDNYIRDSEEDYRKVERIYFNRLSFLTNSLVGTMGGRHLEMPHGAFFDSTTQTDLANTPAPIKFNTTVTNSTVGVSVVNNLSGDPTRVTVQYGGDYNFQFSLQFENTDNVVHSVGVWARINGTDVDDSCGAVTVPARKSALVYGYAIAAWNYVYPMQPGDYFELIWATEDASVTVPYIPAWTTPTEPYNRPATPSAILTVTYASVV